MILTVKSFKTGASFTKGRNSKRRRKRRRRRNLG